MKILPKTAYCMNLDARTDRWAQVQEDFILPEIKLERVSAVAKPERPLNGVAETFNNIVKAAKERGDPYVLIIEDDLRVLDAKKVMDSFENVPEDWEILLGGVYHLCSDKKVVCDNWIKVTDFCSLHFIIINEKIYDKIIDIERHGKHLDRVLGKMAGTDFNTYLMYPMPCQQRPGFSDLRKRNVDDNKRELPWIKNVVNN